MGVPLNKNCYLSYYSDALAKDVFEFLSKEEELDLIKKAQNGDKKAVERLVMANYGFIISNASKWQNQRTSLEDMVESGIVGFIEAIKKFKTDKNVRLVTFAYYHMMNEFNHEVMDCTTVKGVNEGKISSLNDTVGEDCELQDLFVMPDELSPEAVFERKEFYNYLKKSVKLLPERERKVSELVFGIVRPKYVQTYTNSDGLVVEKRISMERIGDELGISKQRVQQIFASAKKLLSDENGAGRYLSGYLAA